MRSFLSDEKMANPKIRTSLGPARHHCVLVGRICCLQHVLALDGCECATLCKYASAVSSRYLHLLGEPPTAQAACLVQRLVQSGFISMLWNLIFTCVFDQTTCYYLRGNKRVAFHLSWEVIKPNERDLVIRVRWSTPLEYLNANQNFQRSLRFTKSATFSLSYQVGKFILCVTVGKYTTQHSILLAQILYTFAHQFRSLERRRRVVVNANDQFVAGRRVVIWDSKGHNKPGCKLKLLMNSCAGAQTGRYLRLGGRIVRDSATPPLVDEIDWWIRRSSKFSEIWGT